jgi:hypothetical protein
MNELLNRIRTEYVGIRQIENDLLRVLWDLDRDLQTHTVSAETYRNSKGNWWQDIVRGIIQHSVNVNIETQSIAGASETHKVDLSVIRESQPIICMEAKAQGNPGYRQGTELKPERRIQSDIDKRLKEVKYTSIDLKRNYGRRVSDRSLSFDREEDWINWKDSAYPKFYAFWLGRKCVQENQELLLTKLRNLIKYVNGLGVFFYEAREPTGYLPIRAFNEEFSIQRAIEQITNELRSA